MSCIRDLIASRQTTFRYLRFSTLPSIQHHYGGTQARALPLLIGSLNSCITHFPCVPNLSRLIATETAELRQSCLYSLYLLTEVKITVWVFFPRCFGGFFWLFFFFHRQGNGNKDSKVHPESQTPCKHIDLASRADENKRFSGRSADAVLDHFKGQDDCLAECSEKKTGQSGAP